MIKFEAKVMIDPLGKPFVDFKGAKNLEEIEAFLRAGQGKTIDVALAAQSEKMLEGGAAPAQIGKPGWEKPLALPAAEKPEPAKEPAKRKASAKPRKRTAKEE